MKFIPDDVAEYVEKYGYIPKYGWRSVFDREVVRSSPPKTPRIKTIAEFMPMGFRYLFNIYFPNKMKQTLPFMDPLNPVKMEPIYGVPLGGIGCGTIGRGFKGEFCRSSLRPGLYNHKINEADQFIVTIKRGGQVYQNVLSSKMHVPHVADGLCSWDWSFPADHGHYIGLYPRSWTVYELPEVNIVLICEQISPVIPHDYKDSCLPVGVFKWTILNFHSTEEARVSITMTWRGARYKRRLPPRDHREAGDICCDKEVINWSVERVKEDRTQPFDNDQSSLRGCLMETRIGDHMPCCFGIAASQSEAVEVTRCLGFQYRTAPTIPKLREHLHFSRYHNATSDNSNAPNIELPESHGVTRSHTDAPVAAEFWKNLKRLGRLSDNTSGYNRINVTKLSSKLAMAVCASCDVPPASWSSSPAATQVNGDAAANGEGDSTQPGIARCEFFVTWHTPRVYFRSAIVAYRRRYCRWFSEDIIKGAEELLNYASANWRKWRLEISKWQDPILSDPDLPDTYKSAIFNELYYISDGGTVWLDPIPLPTTSGHSRLIPIDIVRSRNNQVSLDPLGLTERGSPQQSNGDNGDLENESDSHSKTPFQSRSDLGEEMGLFAYLEGHEYRMFNTYDVHFNASWALIQLWPKLQLSVLYDLVDMTISEDVTPVKFIYKGLRDIRNARLCVPHDCGDPENEPWFSVNAYVMYPSDQWKDLAPKLVLMAWRDWKLTGDDAVLKYTLPVLVAVVRTRLEEWDLNDDGIIENDGFPDQTYDTWKSCGISAYVGGLWIAALYGLGEMLKHHSKNTTEGRWHRQLPNLPSWNELDDDLDGLLLRAKTKYHNRLWQGSFYRYDETIPTDAEYTPVMADQLSGLWFLCLGGAPENAILPQECVLKTLETIVTLNWKQTRSGTMGAVNSIFSNGKKDLGNMQAEEFWVAVNYGIGSMLIAFGMPNDGFALTAACFEHVYNQMGLHYQTPEAFTRGMTFRSLGYMRPLAIWSVQRAVELARAKRLKTGAIHE